MAAVMGMGGMARKRGIEELALEIAQEEWQPVLPFAKKRRTLIHPQNPNFPLLSRFPTDAAAASASCSIDQQQTTHDHDHELQKSSTSSSSCSNSSSADISRLQAAAPDSESEEFQNVKKFSVAGNPENPNPTSTVCENLVESWEEEKKQMSEIVGKLLRDNEVLKKAVRIQDRRLREAAAAQGSVLTEQLRQEVITLREEARLLNLKNYELSLYLQSLWNPHSSIDNHPPPPPVC